MVPFANFRVSLRVLLRAFLAFALFLASLPPMPVEAESDPPDAPDAARVIEMITYLSGEVPFQTTRIYDRQGRVLADIDDRGRRTIVGLDEIPDCVIQATIATEDRRFFTHKGVDSLAIVRAVWQNSQSERIVSGGSTITQQLARLLFMPPSQRYERSIKRKLREAELAQFLETYYSKEEILAMYLNMVYYGHQAYGIAAAAETYFNKSLKDLTLAECALLAGLPQSPVEYDPLEHPRAALQRQRVVLSLMAEAGVIDPKVAIKLKALPLQLHPYRRPRQRAPHFVQYVREMLIERYGTESLYRGLQVYTSLDIRYQKLAESIAQAQVNAVGEKYRFSNAAVVILHPKTAEILAMVGSIDFDNADIDGQVNMAIAPRQPGSSIKPILYAAAFDRGWTPASVIWDLPVSYAMDGGRRYAPTNITRRYYGPVRLRMALANSLNVPAVKLLAEIGVPAMLETAQKLGIASWTKPTETYGLSLAVGGYEVSLLELTHAFATLANNGLYTPLHPVLQIKDGAGKALFSADLEANQQQAISTTAAYQVSSVLSDARARKLMFGRPSPLDTSQITAVKTGTTDGWRDNLTVGYTSYLAIGVWTGNTNGRPMHKAIGAYTAGPIWHDIMEAIWADASLYDTLGYAQASLPQGFPTPPGITTIPVCDWTPGKFNPDCPRMAPEFFPSDSITETVTTGRPTGYCIPASATPAPTEAFFLALPRRSNEASTARIWMRKRYGMAVRNVEQCDTTPKRRPLVRNPDLLPPRQLVNLNSDKNASIAPTHPRPTTEE